MFNRKKSLDELKLQLPREELIRRSRILVVDDERPDLIDDLKSANFAVDHEEDITKDNLQKLDGMTYDVVILDFGDVGKSFGDEEGLSILKHVKRVSPVVVVLAYTSKALYAEHSDFYRLSDGILPKDAGLHESTEKIEEALRKSHSLENQWAGLLQLCNLVPGSSDDRDYQDLFVRGLKDQKKIQTLKDRAVAVTDSDSGKAAVNTVVTKLIELGVKSLIGS